MNDRHMMNDRGTKPKTVWLSDLVTGENASNSGCRNQVIDVVIANSFNSDSPNKSGCFRGGKGVTARGFFPLIEK